MSAHEATIEVLTAEVRVLMVGSRQVTLSVYGQLDTVAIDDIQPFGRVRPKGAFDNWIYVVGSREGGSDLVRSLTPASDGAIQSSEIPDLMTKIREMERLLTRHVQDGERLRAYPLTSDDGSPNPLYAKHAEAEARNREKTAEIRASLDDLHTEAEEITEMYRVVARRWAALPLIVLAGLR